jgi:hypothetical protein
LKKAYRYCTVHIWEVNTIHKEIYEKKRTAPYVVVIFYIQFLPFICIVQVWVDIARLLNTIREGERHREEREERDQGKNGI